VTGALLDGGTLSGTWRCEHCRRILARFELPAGALLEVKCSCNHFNVFYTTSVQAFTSAEALCTMEPEASVQGRLKAQLRAIGSWAFLVFEGR
jgi:phage FluMu protein Com